MGEQRLVGGDHGLARRERRLDRRFGGIAFAAHQLDEHIDAAGLREGLCTLEPGEAAQVMAAILGTIPGANAGDLDGAAGAARDLSSMLGQ